MATGVAGFDEITDGGLPRGGLTVVFGGAGNVASIGIRLQQHIDSGVLRMHSLRARAEGPEAHVAHIRRLLLEHDAHHLVVDPLSALQHRDCDADAEAAALELIDGVKNAGITLVSTSLLGNVLPLNEQTPLNISTIADTWMHVSYVNQGGERNRALTIVKARGTGHSNQVRELILSDSGVTLSDVYASGGEVLMGTLRWEKENEAKRARVATLNRSELLQQKASLALAETNAQLEVLTRAGAIQAAELEQLKATAVADGARYASDVESLLNRRRADRGVPPTSDAELEKPQ